VAANKFRPNKDNARFLSLTCGKTVGTAKHKVYEAITIARVKAAVSRARSAKKQPPAKLSPERLAMPKRNLRVLKWLGRVPVIGVCTLWQSPVQGVHNRHEEGWGRARKS
jgi:hypothetical protein